MNRAIVRTAAALLAAAVTVSGLQGIAVLAETNAAARTTIVVLPPVIVSATATDAAPVVAAHEMPNVLAAVTNDGSRR